MSQLPPRPQHQLQKLLQWLQSPQLLKLVRAQLLQRNQPLLPQNLLLLQRSLPLLRPHQLSQLQLNHLSSELAGDH